jgi:hypothetical protein
MESENWVKATRTLDTARPDLRMQAKSSDTCGVYIMSVLCKYWRKISVVKSRCSRFNFYAFVWFEELVVILEVSLMQNYF